MHAGHSDQYTPTEASAVARRRRGPRWLLAAVLGLAVVAGVAIAIALAVSPSPKPPSFEPGVSSTASTRTAGLQAPSATLSPTPRGRASPTG